MKNIRQFLNSHILQDYFCWINGDKLFFARHLHSKRADWKLNTIQNSKDISLFDASLQHERKGIKNLIITYYLSKQNNADLY